MGYLITVVQIEDGSIRGRCRLQLLRSWGVGYRNWVAIEKGQGSEEEITSWKRVREESITELGMLLMIWLLLKFHVWFFWEGEGIVCGGFGVVFILVVGRFGLVKFPSRFIFHFILF